MYIIAVSKTQEFLLNVRGLFFIFFDDDDAVFTSTHRISY